MLARRVVALTVDKTFGKLATVALKAAGHVLELHGSLASLGTGPLDAALVVLHLDGGLASAVADLDRRLDDDSKIIAVLPVSSLDLTVEVMRASTKVAGVLEASRLEVGDLAAMATRLLDGDIFGLEKLVPWGTRIHSTMVGDYQDKAVCLAQVAEFAESMGVRRKFRDPIIQCLDEMLMNALYDAPVDEHGAPVFVNISTKERIGLRLQQRVVVQYACDGQRFNVSVRDGFGTLARATVTDYLHKCLHAAQQIDRKAGGAGLGLYLTASSSTRFLINVLPGVATECICGFDLDVAKVQLEAFGVFTERIDATGRLAGTSRLLPAGVTHPVERRAPPPARTPRGLVAGLLAAIGLLVALIALVAYPRFRRTPTTTVLIKTEPPEATIAVDGRDRGVAHDGAFLASGLEVGRAYRVAARLDGHAAAETVFQPTSGPPATLVLRLAPERAAVSVDSDPPGAEVLVAGEVLGITPVTLTTLTPGSEVELTFRRRGYRDAIRTLRAPAPGSDSQISQTLAVGPGFASLAITSEPPGAEVEIDGRRELGVTTPATEILVAAGQPHKVTARLPGYLPATATVTPGEGARGLPVAMTLVRGTPVRVAANVEARASMRGVGDCPRRNLPIECVVRPGSQTIEVEATRPWGFAQRVIKVGAAPVEVTVDFGVVAAPDGKRLRVGERLLGRLALEAGRRSVLVVDDASQTATQVEVVVVAGKSTIAR